MNLPPFRIGFGLICLVLLHIFSISVVCDAVYAFDGDNNNVKIRKHGLELTQTLNLQRQEFLQKTCKTLGYDNHTLDDLTDEQMEHMIVDPKHKFMYCYVPKVRFMCVLWFTYMYQLFLFLLFTISHKNWTLSSNFSV